MQIYQKLHGILTKHTNELKLNVLRLDMEDWNKNTNNVCRKAFPRPKTFHYKQTIVMQRIYG